MKEPRHRTRGDGRRQEEGLAAVREGSAGQRHEARVLIFANKIKTVRFLHGLLKKHDVRCLMLHGLRSQAERRAALRRSRRGEKPVARKQCCPMIWFTQ